MSCLYPLGGSYKMKSFFFFSNSQLCFPSADTTSYLRPLPQPLPALAFRFRWVQIVFPMCVFVPSRSCVTVALLDSSGAQRPSVSPKLTQICFSSIGAELNHQIQMFVFVEVKPWGECLDLICRAHSNTTEDGQNTWNEAKRRNRRSHCNKTIPSTTATTHIVLYIALKKIFK